MKHGNMGFILWPSGSATNQANAQRVLGEMTTKYGNPQSCDEANANLSFLQSEVIRMQGDSTASTGWYRDAYNAIIPQLQAYIAATCTQQVVTPPPVTTGGGATTTPPGTGTGGDDNNSSSWLLALGILGVGIYIAHERKGKKKLFN